MRKLLKRGRLPPRSVLLVYDEQCGAQSAVTLPAKAHYRLLKVDPVMSKMAATASMLLQSKGITNRLGGSLAAHTYKATRSPQDIDLETGNDEDLGKAVDVLGNLNKTVWLNGETFRVKGERVSYSSGEFGQANLSFYFNNGRDLRTITADIVNENNNLFNKYLIPPREREVGNKGILTKWELMVNYLDRSLHKSFVSEPKGDAEQITSMLKNKPRLREKLRVAISKHVKPEVVQDYLNQLDKLVPQPMEVDVSDFEGMEID